MKSLFIAAFAIISMANVAFAQAPVVDLNQSQRGAVAYPASSQSGSPSLYVEPALSPGDELKVLKQQITNITQLDLPGKIDALQQQIQEFNGRLEVQAHQIDTLTTQQKSFYEDLSQRLTNPQASSAMPAPLSSASTDSSSAQDKVVPSNDLSTQSPNDISSIPQPSPATDPGAEEKAYQSAFDLLTKKKNTDAINAFSTLLTSYPNGKRTASTYYWLGELYGSEKKNDLAAKQFNLLVTQYPGDDKVPDAMLKLAIIDDSGGQTEKARQRLAQIVQKYPNSGAARLAKMRLERK
jgi:tol-pal system protein YbgF